MISITADSYGLNNMAKQQLLQFTWGQVGAVIAGIAAAFWIVSSVVNQDIRDRLLSINTSITRIEIDNKSHGKSLVRMEEKLKYLDHRVELLEKPHYESKAKAAGIKAPQIIPTSLQSQSKFESKVEVGAQKVALHYTIIKYDPENEVMTLRVDEDVPGFVIRNNIFTFSAKQGQSIELPHFFPNFPKVFMRVIDRPSPDRAILAIGEKADPGGNRS
nr:hypothetical protein [Nitrosomonas nitrosa]